MSKKKEDKKMTKDQAEKKILTLKKDLFNIRFKKINNQIKECEWFLLENKTYCFEAAKINVEDIFGVFRFTDRQVYNILVLF